MASSKKKAKGPAFEVYQKPDAESQVYVAGAADKKKKSQQDVEQNPKTAQAKNKQPPGKQKFTSLDLEKLRDGLLPGRHACICLASKHKLLGNCLRCGRIICEQEGPGPCMTCGNEVFDKKQQGKIAQKIHEQLVSVGLDQISSAEVQKLLQKEEEARKAEEYKNKLLEYDRSSAKRTKVIDDETDYFSSETNTWLNSKEKERLKAREAEIQKAREEKEKQRRVTIDIAGRKIVESQADDKEAMLKKMYQEEVEDSRSDLASESTGYFAHSSGQLPLTPKFVLDQGRSARAGAAGSLAEKKSRVQHDFDAGTVDLAEPSATDEVDQGLCLSMWQPWASLLVYGIKKVEGRSWPTSHRGRLWIAAAAKKPSPEEMKLVIEQHLAQCPEGTKTPKIYPTSCLLGAVDIEDCLSQSEYQAKFPDALARQSESDFVFICARPRLLETPIPIAGQHKIWNLEPETLEQCRQKLLP